MEGLDITTKPLLPTNEQLEKDFRECLSKLVKFSPRTTSPRFFIFRPCGRPRDEFMDYLRRKDEIFQDDVVLIIAYNKKKGKAFLDDQEHEFKAVEAIVLTDRTLNQEYNKETFNRLADFLVTRYGFKRLEDDKEVENELQPEGGKSNTDPNSSCLKKKVSDLSKKITNEDSQQNVQTIKEIRKRYLSFAQPLTMVIVGPSSQERSSFVNSLRSAIEDIEKPCTEQGKANSQFHCYRYRDHCLLDSGFTAKDRYQGHLNDISTLLRTWSKTSKICVVIVLNHEDCIGKNVEDLMELVSAEDVAVQWLVILTKNDTVSVTESERVSHITGHPAGQISFVRTLTTENKADSHITLQYLSVLNRIMDMFESRQIVRKSYISCNLMFPIFCICFFLALGFGVRYFYKRYSFPKINSTLILCPLFHFVHSLR